MSEHRTGPGRVSSAFEAGHGRIAEMRTNLGITGPVPEAVPDTTRRSVDEAGPVGPRAERRGHRRRRAGDLTLIVLWSAMLGLVVAAVITTT